MSTVSGMTQVMHWLGDEDDMVITLEESTDGGVTYAAVDLTGWTVRLKFNAIDPGETDFEKDSDSDSDWIEITDAANGEVTVHFAERPSGVPTDRSTKYVVGCRLEKAANSPKRFGSAVWEFRLPDEGLYDIAP